MAEPPEYTADGLDDDDPPMKHSAAELIELIHAFHPRGIGVDSPLYNSHDPTPRPHIVARQCPQPRSPHPHRRTMPPRTALPAPTSSHDDASPPLGSLSATSREHFVDYPEAQGLR